MFTPFAFVQGSAAAPAPGYQPLTEAFRVASGISDATTLNSLNAFEIGLTNYSIATSSFDAIYPFVGASSGSFKFNFVNTTKYNLTYTGSLTFTTGGFAATGSPINGRGGGPPGTLISTASYCSYFYVTDPKGAAGNFTSPIGHTRDQTAGVSLTQYYLQWFGTTELVHPCNSATGQGNGSINSGVQGLAKGGFALNRTAVNSMKAFYNGSQTGATNTTTLTNRGYSAFVEPINILSRQNNTDTTVALRMGWASVGPGLTDTQMANYHTLVANFQTSMSRA